MKTFRVVGIFLLLVALLYLPFLGNAFVSDDSSITAMADPHRTWVGAIGWPTAIHAGGLVHYVIYHIFGPTPWPYRLVNILLHAGNVTLVWLILRKHTTSRIAFVAAVLFAIHPLAVESVTWIAGGVVYAYYSFFFLLSLYLYRNTSLVTWIVSLVSFVISLSISDKALPLFILFGFYEWMFGDIRKHWKHWIPYIAVTIPFILFYTTQIGPRIMSVEESSSLHIGLYNPIFQLSLALGTYIELFLWPKHLTFYHASVLHLWGDFAVRAAATAAYLGATLIGLIRKKPYGFWLAWVCIALGVTLLPVKIARIVAERYIYLGFIGFCVAAAMLFERIVSSKKWGIAVIGICLGITVVIALGTRTIIRNSEWRTADSLWVATLRESPEDPNSWNNMGDVYGRHGLYDKSIEAFTQATIIDPRDSDAYHNIGRTYAVMKKYEEAVPYFEKALSINPNLWQSYQELAVIAAEKKEYQKALEYTEKAVNINPSSSALQHNVQLLHRAILAQ